ncbi:hypothetical protein ACNS7O_05670 [Haloferacaceae archaeon DSL9]
MSNPHDLDLDETETDALHEIQLGIEHLYEAFGHLVAFHHGVGHAMDRMANAEEYLRESGHEEFAEELRTTHLPAGAIDDMWTYEVVETFRWGLLTDMNDFESRVRTNIAEGVHHVKEREQQHEWRQRGDWYENDGNTEKEREE